LIPGKALAAAAPAKSVIAHAAVNARVLPLWMAKDQGFFTKYGVPAEMIFIRQAPTLVAALTSGDIQIGYTGGTAVLGAAASGSDLKILAAFTNRVTYDVVLGRVSRPRRICAAKYSASRALAERSGWAPFSRWNTLAWIRTGIKSV
jgi:hypothetical protein